MKYSDYRKKDRTKRLIIEKAAPVFNKKGYSATTMSDLLQVTGLSKGSIYGNFKNKEELALCAFEHNAEFVNQCLKDRINSAETSRDKLLAYPLAFRKIYKSIIANGGCPLLNTAVDSSEINKELHKAVSRRVDRWRQALISILQECRSKKEISQNTNVKQMAEILICLAEGGYAMTKATDDLSYIESSIEEMERMINSL